MHPMFSLVATHEAAPSQSTSRSLRSRHDEAADVESLALHLELNVVLSRPVGARRALHERELALERQRLVRFEQGLAPLEHLRAPLAAGFDVVDDEIDDDKSAFAAFDLDLDGDCPTDRSTRRRNTAADFDRRRFVT